MSDPIVVLAPLIVFIVIGMFSVFVDLREHRLPNPLTVLLTIALISAQLFVSLSTRDWSVWSGILTTTAWVTATYLGLYLLSRGSLGFGDVKFALPCAIVIGTYAPTQWLAALWIAFGAAALSALALFLLGKASRSSAIAFGPFMYLSVLIVAIRAITSG